MILWNIFAVLSKLLCTAGTTRPSVLGSGKVEALKYSSPFPSFIYRSGVLI